MGPREVRFALSKVKTNGFSRDSVNLKVEFSVFSRPACRPRVWRLRDIHDLRDAGIDVMQPAEDGGAGDFAFGSHRAGNGRVFVQGHMRAGDVVIVVDVVGQH